MGQCGNQSGDLCRHLLSEAVSLLNLREQTFDSGRDALLLRNGGKRNAYLKELFGTNTVLSTGAKGLLSAVLPQRPRLRKPVKPPRLQAIPVGSEGWKLARAVASVQ